MQLASCQRAAVLPLQGQALRNNSALYHPLSCMTADSQAKEQSYQTDHDEGEEMVLSASSSSGFGQDMPAHKSTSTRCIANLEQCLCSLCHFSCEQAHILVRPLLLEAIAPAIVPSHNLTCCCIDECKSHRVNILTAK